MPNLKTVANVGEKAVRAGAKVLPKLVPLGRALAVMRATATARARGEMTMGVVSLKNQQMIIILK